MADDSRDNVERDTDTYRLRSDLRMTFHFSCSRKTGILHISVPQVSPLRVGTGVVHGCHFGHPRVRSPAVLTSAGTHYP